MLILFHMPGNDLDCKTLLLPSPQSTWDGWDRWLWKENTKDKLWARSWSLMVLYLHLHNWTEVHRPQDWKAHSSSHLVLQPCKPLDLCTWSLWWFLWQKFKSWKKVQACTTLTVIFCRQMFYFENYDITIVLNESLHLKMVIRSVAYSVSLILVQPPGVNWRNLDHNLQVCYVSHLMLTGWVP